MPGNDRVKRRCEDIASFLTLGQRAEPAGFLSDDILVQLNEQRFRLAQLLARRQELSIPALVLDTAVESEIRV